MKFSFALFFVAVAVADSPAKRAGTISVTGSPPGFAYGVTGGGKAAPVYPTDVKNLIELLESDDPQVIVIDKTFDFIGTEEQRREQFASHMAPLKMAASPRSISEKDAMVNRPSSMSGILLESKESVFTQTRRSSESETRVFSSAKD
jgi:hypothetical protein